ncbi:hypothetical protein H4582DRAFT_2129341 [Lactarius indigo]|nr:hypothetical protein H4582DRAFT_2129341 [Lactarius indigo]
MRSKKHFLNRHPGELGVPGPPVSREPPHFAQVPPRERPDWRALRGAHPPKEAGRSAPTPSRARPFLGLSTTACPRRPSDTQRGPSLTQASPPPKLMILGVLGQFYKGCRDDLTRPLIRTISYRLPPRCCMVHERGCKRLTKKKATHSQGHYRRSEPLFLVVAAAFSKLLWAIESYVFFGSQDLPPVQNDPRPCKTHPTYRMNFGETHKKERDECVSRVTQLDVKVQTMASIFSVLNGRTSMFGREGLAQSMGLNDVTPGPDPGCSTDGYTAIAGLIPTRLVSPVLCPFASLLTLGTVGRWMPGFEHPLYIIDPLLRKLELRIDDGSAYAPLYYS